MRLVQTEMPEKDSLKVMAMAQQSPESRGKIRTIIEKIIDSDKSSLGKLVGDVLLPILGDIPELKGLFESREVDNSLLSAYDKKKLSTLALAVSELAMKGDKAAALAQFQAKVKSAIPAAISVDSAHEELMTKLVFDSLLKIALVLTV